MTLNCCVERTVKLATRTDQSSHKWTLYGYGAVRPCNGSINRRPKNCQDTFGGCVIMAILFRTFTHQLRAIDECPIIRTDHQFFDKVIPTQPIGCLPRSHRSTNPSNRDGRPVMVGEGTTTEVVSRFAQIMVHTVQGTEHAIDGTTTIPPPAIEFSTTGSVPEGPKEYGCDQTSFG